MKPFSFDDVVIKPPRSVKNVVVRGPILTQSGYGIHARQLVRWLMAKHEAGTIRLRLQPTRWGDTPWYVSHDGLGGFVGRIMELCSDDVKQFDLSFQVQLPNEWDSKLASTNVGVTAAVETDRCNPKWVQACNAMSRVIVPSRHAESCLRASGDVHTPISVVPESFPDCFLDSPRQIDLDLPAEFNFLVIGQLTSQSPENDRKRIQETLRWLCKEFDGDETTGIVIKTNSGKGSKIDRVVCERIIADAASGRKDGFPRVTMLHGYMSDKEMQAVYAHPKIGAYVTATHGEGYGLTVLEAAAAGVPVVATNWSGHLDFMSHGKFVRLACTLKQIPQSRCDENIFMPGTRWANVEESEFRAKVKKLRKSHSLPREWASELKEKVLQEYRFERIAALYDDALGSVL